eukprot:NODE_196_length_15381_cov_0.267243.p9 type:complete len:109 gc:universal NODE_196_length_15381_cov_0.267243:9466-9140(-)
MQPYISLSVEKKYILDNLSDEIIMAIHPRGLLRVVMSSASTILIRKQTQSILMRNSERKWPIPINTEPMYSFAHAHVALRLPRVAAIFGSPVCILHFKVLLKITLHCS